MQGYSWDDLRYALALYRTGSLAAAGRQLGVNETTVARRLAHLQGALGTEVFLRSNTGRYEPTETGLRLLDRAEEIERAHTALEEAAQDHSQSVRGIVRLSAVPVLINRLIVPALPALLSQHPDLTVDLVPEGRNADLVRREADLALRFARPEQGGTLVKARKLADLTFGVFGPASPKDTARDAWITYSDGVSDLPQARWIAERTKNASESVSGLRVADLETAMEAVAQGLGRSLLPVAISRRDARLKALSDTVVLSRPLWLLSENARGTRQAIDVVKRWLIEQNWIGCDT